MTVISPGFRYLANSFYFFAEKLTSKLAIKFNSFWVFSRTLGLAVFVCGLWKKMGSCTAGYFTDFAQDLPKEGSWQFQVWRFEGHQC